MAKKKVEIVKPVADKPVRKKTGGRKPGIPNKITQDVRLQLKDILTGEMSTLASDLSLMSPSKKWETITNLMKFCIPQLSASKVESNIEGNVSSDIKITVEYSNPIDTIQI